MNPQRIESVVQYNTFRDKYQHKSSLTNNYLLPDEVALLIASSKLSAVLGQRNCYFLAAQESGCKRLYYIINDVDELTELPHNIVCEILFRTPSGVPEADVTHLKRLGFQENLIRDQYSAKVLDGKDVSPDYSADLTEAKKIARLFNDSFDKYSGDFISNEETQVLQNNKSLLVVKEDGKLKGAMHITFLGSALWISHIAVYPEYRGQGIANKLMAMYFTLARQLGAKRLMLWVQRRNTAAVQMYNKYGFIPVNKSTISFIKY